MAKASKGEKVVGHLASKSPAQYLIRSTRSHNTSISSANQAVTMVKLEEVPDEELNAPQAGNKEEEDDWDTDSGRHRELPGINAALICI